MSCNRGNCVRHLSILDWLGRFSQNPLSFRLIFGCLFQYGYQQSSGSGYSPPARDTYQQPSAVQRSPPTQQPTSGGSSAPSKYGGGDKCPRCNKTVYFAEAREGPNNVKYHKMCFTCVVCRKVVDSTFTERQGDIYCKTCYGKEFGPKGEKNNPSQKCELKKGLPLPCRTFLFPHIDVPYCILQDLCIRLTSAVRRNVAVK